MISINQIIEQEDENLIKREILVAKEALYKSNLENGSSKPTESIEAINTEWTKLRSELYSIVIYIYIYIYIYNTYTYPYLIDISIHILYN